MVLRHASLTFVSMHTELCCVNMELTTYITLMFSNISKCMIMADLNVQRGARHEYEIPLNVKMNNVT